MIKLNILMVMIFGMTMILQAQVAINKDDSQADPSAMLDVKSTTQGFLLPRMMALQRDVIPNPAEGLIIYCTDCNEMQFFNGSVWMNATGDTAYTPPWNCGDPFYDPRDLQIYSSVEINTQCWMAENLNIGTMINSGTNQSSNSTIEKYCYDNIAADCGEYGGLYQWNEAMQYVTTQGAQGICPDGWHIPSEAEWCTLEQYADPSISCSTTGYRGTDGGGKLKETGTTHWDSPNTGATDVYGFTAIASGLKMYNSAVFSARGERSYFWTSSNYFSSDAYLRDVNYDNAQIRRDHTYRNFGLSVRCLMD